MQKFIEFIMLIKNGGDPIGFLLDSFPLTERESESFSLMSSRRNSVTFNISPKGAWTYSCSQFLVSVDFDGGPKYNITLPYTYNSYPEAESAPNGFVPHHDNALIRLRDLLGMSLEATMLHEREFFQAIIEKGNKKNASFLVDLHDGAGFSEVIDSTLTMSRLIGDNHVLIYDEFYFKSRGYIDHIIGTMEKIDFWDSRSDLALWRGSTTGWLGQKDNYGAQITLENMSHNPRIGMVKYCSFYPEFFDAKITNVVQVRHDQVDEVRRQLELENLLSGWSHMSVFREHKFALHIDGNATAAGFLEKMSLGCCVLRIKGNKEQWFESDLEEWVHYVPVRSDLKDLLFILNNLRENNDLAKKIALNGFEFAKKRSIWSESKISVINLKTILLDSFECFFLYSNESITNDDWNDIELSDSQKKFKWTKKSLIQWKIQRKTNKNIKIIIEAVHQISENFMRNSVLEVNGIRYNLNLINGYWVALCHDVNDDALNVKLHTPPPMRPCDIEGSSNTDAREVGVAISAT